MVFQMFSIILNFWSLNFNWYLEQMEGWYIVNMIYISLSKCEYMKGDTRMDFCASEVVEKAAFVFKFR